MESRSHRRKKQEKLKKACAYEKRELWHLRVLTALIVVEEVIEDPSTNCYIIIKR